MTIYREIFQIWLLCIIKLVSTPHLDNIISSRRQSTCHVSKLKNFLSL